MTGRPSLSSQIGGICRSWITSIVDLRTMVDMRAIGVAQSGKKTTCGLVYPVGGDAPAATSSACRPPGRLCDQLGAVTPPTWRDDERAIPLCHA